MEPPVKPDLSQFSTMTEQRDALRQYKRDLTEYEATKPVEGGPDFSGRFGGVKAFLGQSANELMFGGGDEAAGFFNDAMAVQRGEEPQLTNRVDAADNWLSEAERQRPGSSMAGQLAGLLGSGMGSAKVATSVGRKAARPAMRAFDSVLGRTAGQATIAGADGALRAALEGRNVPAEAGLSAAFGGAMQLTIGEFMSGVVNSARGKPTRKDKAAAQSYFSSLLEGMGYGGTPEAAAYLAREADRLGPNATLLDLDPVLSNLGVNLRKGSYKDTDALTFKLRSRLPDDPYMSTVGEFMEGKVPRTPKQMQRVLSSYKQQVGPAFSEAYTAPNARGLGGNPLDFSRAFVDTNLSRFGRKEQLKEFTAARKKLNDVIADTTKDRQGNRWLKTDSDGKLVVAKGRDPQKAALYLKDLDANTLHMLRRKADTMLSSAARSKNGLSPTVGAYLAKTRSAITRRLNQVPEFKQASAQFKQAEDFSVGYELGYNSFNSPKFEPEDFAEVFDSLDDASSSAFLEGTLAALRKSYRDKGKNGFAELMSDSGSREYNKLVSAFGKDRVQALIDNADRGVRFENMFDAMVEAGAKTDVPANKVDLSSFIDLGLASSLVMPKTSTFSNAAAIGGARRAAGKLPKPGQQRMERALISELERSDPELIQFYLDEIAGGKSFGSTAEASDITGATLGGIASFLLRGEDE